MKYKIIKKYSKKLKVTHPLYTQKTHIPESTSIEKNEWYEAKRKGRIFGFWHKVGHEYDFDGMVYQHTTHTLEEMRNYIRDWHEVNYGDKCKCEIIEKIEL